MAKHHKLELTEDEIQSLIFGIMANRLISAHENP